MKAENRRLRAWIAELEQQVKELRPKAILYDRYKRKLVGDFGEDLVARWFLAERIFGNKDHDLVTSAGSKLEVKYSRLALSDERSPRCRWKWTGLLGNGGEKDYDRLLLVGEINHLNAEYRLLYADPEADYILFDLPGSEVRRFWPRGHLNLSANPRCRVPCLVRDHLFQDRQVTVAKLRAKYGPSAHRNEQN